LQLPPLSSRNDQFLYVQLGQQTAPKTASNPQPSALGRAKLQADCCRIKRARRRQVPRLRRYRQGLGALMISAGDNFWPVRL